MDKEGKFIDELKRIFCTMQLERLCLGAGSY